MTTGTDSAGDQFAMLGSPPSPRNSAVVIEECLATARTSGLAYCPATGSDNYSNTLRQHRAW
jgi:hypothetical protein